MRDCCKSCVKHEVSCPVKDCAHWISYKDDLNCVFVAIDKHGKMTLRETADRIGVSFVRIKQIEDKAVKKLAENNLDMKKYLYDD